MKTKILLIIVLSFPGLHGMEKDAQNFFFHLGQGIGKVIESGTKWALSEKSPDPEEIVPDFTPLDGMFSRARDNGATLREAFNEVTEEHKKIESIAARKNKANKNFSKNLDKILEKNGIKETPPSGAFNGAVNLIKEKNPLALKLILLAAEENPRIITDISLSQVDILRSVKDAYIPKNDKQKNTEVMSAESGFSQAMRMYKDEDNEYGQNTLREMGERNPTFMNGNLTSDEIMMECLTYDSNKNRLADAKINLANLNIDQDDDFFVDEKFKDPFYSTIAAFNHDIKKEDESNRLALKNNLNKTLKLMCEGSDEKTKEIRNKKTNEMASDFLRAMNGKIPTTEKEKLMYKEKKQIIEKEKSKELEESTENSEGVFKFLVKAAETMAVKTLQSKSRNQLEVNGFPINKDDTIQDRLDSFDPGRKKGKGPDRSDFR